MSLDPSSAPLVDLLGAASSARAMDQGPERLRRTLPGNNDPVFVRDHLGLHRIDRRDISRVMAEGNYVEVHTSARRYVLRNSLCEVLAQLGHDLFVQVNRSTVVNLHHIDRVGPDEVEIAGRSLTLSRCFRTALLQRIRILGGR